ncbi:MAG TPA: PilZ domain-containing protein [Propylenella sp.]|nr:PilZ domain-containing protein [Propylenella sp.]
MSALQAQQTLASRESDRRRYQRVKISLLGRCMFPDRRECPCQLIEVSPGDAVFVSPFCGEPGEKVIAYIDNIGRLEGVIVERVEHGFLMSISASQRKRDKLADTLTWLANRHVLNLAEDRRHLRRTPKRTDADIVFADGTAQTCRVIDMSLSGAAVATSIRPPLGSAVKLGRLGARVVRHFDDGIGIEFMRLMSDDAIEQTIEREYF